MLNTADYIINGKEYRNNTKKPKNTPFLQKGFKKTLFKQGKYFLGFFNEWKATSF